MLWWVIPRVGAFATRLGESAGLLAEALELRFALDKELARLYVYASMLSDLDTRESEPQGMQQEMQQMAGMLQRVQQSMEAQKLQVDQFKAQSDAEIKAYEAETRRLQAVQAGMSPEQVQEVVMQTLRDVMTVGDMAMQQRVIA